MSTPESVMLQGRELAMRMLAVIDPDLFEPPVVVHALAFMLAALLSAAGGYPTMHEQMGLGLLGDEDRLALFKSEVLEIVKGIREANPRKDVM